MEQTLTQRFTPRLMIGLTLIWLGVFWMIDELGFHEAHGIGEFWPVGIILLGVSIALNGGGWVSSLIIGGLGFFLLNESAGLVDFDLFDLWPLVLVILGARMVMKGFGHTSRSSERGASRVRSIAIFGNRHQKIESTAFERADATAVLGSSNLDLTAAGLSEGASIDLFCLAGGITIRVSPDTRVVSEVVPFMAGYEDKRTLSGAPRQTLHLRGVVMWGGVEILSSQEKAGESW